jgi:hypothetical protein
VEDKAKSDHLSVANGVYYAANEPSNWWVDAGGDTIRQAIGGLDERREDDHDEDGEAKALGVGVDKDHDVFNNKNFDDGEGVNQANVRGQNAYSHPALLVQHPGIDQQEENSARDKLGGATPKVS